MAKDDDRIDEQRRRFLAGAATGCVAAVAGAPVGTAHAAPRVEAGDVLVAARGDGADEPIDPTRLEPLEAVLAYPRSSSGEIRKSKSSMITVVRVPEGELDERFADTAAGDIVALSAVCPHQGCLVADIGTLGQGKGKLKCACHGSVFDPRVGGKVLQGPASRSLASLPIAVREGTLVVTGEFDGKVGV